MKKIVFIDVDGTIYKSHQLLIDESINNALLDLSKHADLYLSTGRCDAVLAPLGSAVEYFKGMVLSNGALVYLNKKIIVDERINKDNLKQLIKVAKKHKMNIALITKDKVFINEFTEVVDYALTPFKENSIVVLNSYDFDLDLEYNMAWSFDKKEDILKLQEECPCFSYFFWGSIGADIIIKNISKAYGIKHLLKQIDKDTYTYAIGDSNNDLEMFDLVDVPICMDNGSEDAKQKAKHITESIYDNGFENAVSKIIKGEW